MARVSRMAVLCLAGTSLIGAASINFDDLNTSGGNVALGSQYADVIFGTVANGSSGTNGGSTCTRSGGCEFVATQTTGGGIMVPTPTNYAAIAANAGVNVVLDFTAAAGSVNSVSFDLLGLAANQGGFFDGATVSFLDASNNVISSQTINPVGPTSTTMAWQTISFNSATAIHGIEFSKISNASGEAMFGFDNLTFGPAAVPEPGSLFLIGGGMLSLALLRRRRAS